MKYFLSLIFTVVSFFALVAPVLGADPILKDLTTQLDQTAKGAQYTTASEGASLESRIGGMIQYALGIIGAVAVLFIIYGGFQWVVSGGNSDKAASGKSTVINASVGLLVVGISYVIIAFALSLIS